MAYSMSDFERFLYANYPDDYRRATAHDVSDDVINAILSKHETHYNIWRHIPEWIKDKYNDDLPSEVLNGNEPVKEFIQEEEKKMAQETKENQEILSYSLSLLALGYAAETVAQLVANREKRAAILAEANGNPLSEEQMKRWLLTRENDRKTLETEWKNNHPEKYITYLFKEMDREKKRIGRVESEYDKLAAELKINRMKKDIAQALARLSDKEQKQKMVDYLKSQPQQVALKHFSEETRADFFDTLRKFGIAVEAKNGKADRRQNLAECLKNDFETCQKKEDILSSKFLYQNQSFNRTSAKEILEKAKHIDINTLIAARQAGYQYSNS